MEMNYLSIIVRHSRMFLEHQLLELSIGYAEETILMYLLEHDHCNQDTIAKHFLLDKGTIAKTITKLEEKNLIQRLENPLNKREKLISLTEKGNALIAPIQFIISDLHKQLFKGLSSDDIKQLTSYMNTLSENAAHMSSKNERDYHENEI